MTESEIKPLVDELISLMRKGMQNFYIKHADLCAGDIMVINSSAITYLLSMSFYMLTKDVDQPIIDDYLATLSTSFKQVINHLEQQKKKVND